MCGDAPRTVAELGQPWRGDVARRPRFQIKLAAANGRSVDLAPVAPRAPWPAKVLAL